jgi:hypothetical protein
MALYMPDCPVNCLPPQQLVNSPDMDTANTVTIKACGICVVYIGKTMLFPYDPHSNLLPILKMSGGANLFTPPPSPNV